MIPKPPPQGFFKQPASSAGLQFVGGKALAIARGTTNVTVPLTGLTGGVGSQPAAGDLVIVGYAQGHAKVNTSITVVTAGYTEHVNRYNDYTSVGSHLSLCSKIMGGTPDTDVVVTPTGATSRDGVVCIHVWRNANATQPDVVCTQTSANVASGVPDPPAITPSTLGAVVVAFGAAADFNVAVPANTNPGSYDNFFSAGGPAQIGGIAAAMGSMAWTSGSLNPAAFGNSSSIDGWAAITMAIRPA